MLVVDGAREPDVEHVAAEHRFGSLGQRSVAGRAGRDVSVGRCRLREVAGSAGLATAPPATSTLAAKLATTIATKGATTARDRGAGVDLTTAG